jgi:hypothetical protein
LRTEFSREAAATVLHTSLLINERRGVLAEPRLEIGVRFELGDIERVTTGHLVTIMKLPHRLDFTDCFDEGNIRAVLKRVNDIPPGTLPPEPPDAGDSIIE